MKRTVIIIILISLRIPLFCQINISDTFNILLKQNLPDSDKIDKLNQYIIQYSSNNPEITLIYSDSAIALSEKILDSARLAMSVNRKGVAFFFLGDYNSSLESYFLALSIKGKTGDTISVWRENNNIGLVLRNLEQNEEALKYFRNALNLIEKSDNRSFEATVWNNIGISYRGLKKYAEAKQAIEKALAINNRNGAIQEKAFNYNNLGHINIDQKDYQSAIEYISKALEINRTLHNRYEEIQNLNNLSRVYLELHNYPKAKLYLNYSEALLNEFPSNQLKLNNVLLFGDYYTKLQDYKNAVKYRDKYIALRDSLLYTNRKKQFDQLKTLANIKNEIQKVTFLEKINSIQEEKIQILRIIQIGGGFVIILILSLLFMVIRDLKIKKKLNTSLVKRTNEIVTLNEELQCANEELMAQRDNLGNVLSDLQKTQKHLIKSEKMASIGVLAAGVAHEINNPLNFIHGGVLGLENYIKENLEDHLANVLPLIEAIRTGVTRSANIVSSLNHYSRTDELIHSNCDLNLIIDNCLIILNNQLKHKIEIQKYYTDSPYILTGNEGKLHQAFLNIISNAAHSIDSTGKITITTITEDNFIIISIIDTGCGISDENMNKIFDPFFTTKEPGKGIGLGLSITYNIIQEHNGTIDYKSRAGEGTQVIIKLPILTT